MRGQLGRVDGDPRAGALVLRRIDQITEVQVSDGRNVAPELPVSVRLMAFRGFPPEALTFYEGLEADNSKTYWTAQKDVYERAVKEPMEALCAELDDDGFGPMRIFRPYRDVRFSKDNPALPNLHMP